jgi:protein-glutamine gamma-glutamyltransferase
MDADMQLLASRRIVNRVRYRARSYTRYAADADAAELAMQDWLELPPGYNPETMQFAVDLQNRIVPAGAGQRHEYDAQLVQAVLDHLRRGGFRYTMTPPTLGRNQIDDFLFRTRLGYCEHYAAAFVVLMRALDVPARVVTGYQGGELNPADGYMTVRQSDAHAWAEVWLSGRGWVRFDPTQVVAPLRIERGAPAITRAYGLARLGVAAPLAWAHALRLHWEAIENGWNQWVLTYSFDRQKQIMKALGMAASWQSLALLFAAVLIGILAMLGFTSLRHRDARPDPLALLFRRLRGKLAAAGMDAAPHHGPRALAGALPGRLVPADAALARALLLDLERARYGRPQGDARAEQRRLARRVRRFRPRVRR